MFSRWEPPTPDFAALVDQKLANFNDVVSLKSQVIYKSNKYFFASCDIIFVVYDRRESKNLSKNANAKLLEMQLRII